MCGIAGCIGSNPPRTAGWLKQMQDSLRKRGPDDCGMWQSANVALVHTRLSIIDVAGSPQPMTNHDASLVVTYNGEIYNYRNLRRQLQGRGHEFRTQGDTEVLLHLYRECGSTMLRELDGMFAFALYDARERKLLLARDRAGIKFLSTGTMRRPANWRLRTTLAGLHTNRAMPRSLNPRALAQCLHFGYVVHPDSWLKDVQQVEPGQALEWQNGKLRATRYYRCAISRVHGWPMPVRLRMNYAAAWVRPWPAIWKRPMCRGELLERRAGFDRDHRAGPERTNEIRRRSRLVYGAVWAAGVR